MTKISPVVDGRLCIVYIAQTFARWHDGVARPEWADYWLQKYGSLTEEETAEWKMSHSQLVETI